MNQQERKPRRRGLRVTLAIAAAAVVLMVAGGAVVAYAAVSTTHYAEGGRRVSVEAKAVPGLGTVLVTGKGLPLYTYTQDRARAVTCTGLCTLDWPALGVRSANDVVAGPGVDRSQLGTVSNSGSLRVVTYHGWPLYTFSSDHKAGQFAGQGKSAYGAFWYAVRPSGAIVTTAQKAAP